MVFRGSAFVGPAIRTYEIPPLPPGRYYFHCDVHPTPAMTGVLRVG